MSRLPRRHLCYRNAAHAVNVEQLPAHRLAPTGIESRSSLLFGARLRRAE
jgi:hypothetical protein